MIIHMRRVILVGVILICLVTLALAMTGHFKPPAPPDPPKPARSQEPQTKLDFESQHFKEFNLPRTDDTGRKESIIEGEYAILHKNRYYEITKPRIIIFSSPKAKPGDPQSAVITADKASLDKASQEATLEGHVVIQECVLDGQNPMPKADGTRVVTDRLHYEPEHKRVKTDSAIALSSEGVEITGRGLEADTVAQNVMLQREVVVELAAAEGGFFTAGQPKSATRKPRSSKPDPVRITCAGSLLYQQSSHVVTFSDAVKVTKTASSLLCDRLVAFLDSETRKVSKLDASGNVKLVDTGQEGTGTKLNWDAQAQTGLLAGEPARVLMKDLTLEATRITFNQKENKITTEGGGHLLTKTRPPPAAPGAKPASQTPADDKVEVFWQGNMLFDGNAHTAVFYDAVQLARGAGKLDCQRLELALDDQHQQVKKLLANDKVRMVDADKEAEGDELLWNAEEQTGILSGRSNALVKQGNVRLSAKRMDFDERNSTVTTQGGGEAHVTPSSPASPNAPSDQAEQIDIRWKDKMTLESARQVATFIGDVSAVRGDSRIRSETMQTFFDDQRKLSRIVAEKSVAIANPSQEGAGDHFEWDVKSQVMTLTGTPAARIVTGNRVLACEKIIMYQAEDRAEGEGVGHLEVRQDPRPTVPTPPKPQEPDAVVDWDKKMVFANRDNKATFWGNVRVRREDAALNADMLDVFFENEQVKRATAVGNVVLKDAQTEGYGTQLTWEWADDIAVLTGTPEAETRQKGLCTFAEKITYLRKTGEIRWEGQRPPRFKTMPDKLGEKTVQPPK